MRCRFSGINQGLIVLITSPTGLGFRDLGLESRAYRAHNLSNCTFPRTPPPGAFRRIPNSQRAPPRHFPYTSHIPGPHPPGWDPRTIVGPRRWCPLHRARIGVPPAVDRIGVPPPRRGRAAFAPRLECLRCLGFRLSRMASLRLAAAALLSLLDLNVCGV